MARYALGRYVPPAPSLLLEVSANNRYLQRSTGEPFQIRGTSLWVIVNLSQADVTLLLDDAVAKGFNSIVCESCISPQGEAQYGPPNYYGQTPFTDSDFTPNLTFWAHVKWIVEQAAARGIVVQMTYLYAGHRTANDGWANYVGAASSAECFAFGAWLGAYFLDDDNIIWVAGGDDTPADPTKWDQIAAGIVSVDTRHLITGHPQRGESGRDFGSYITLNSTYQAYTAVASGTLADYQHTPTLPTFGFEFEYEGDGSPWFTSTLSAAQVRVEAWQCNLSGGKGANYGNHAVWPAGVVATVLVYTDWRDEVDAEGAQGMAHMHAFFDAIDWATLVPDDTSTFVTAGRSSGATYVAAAFTSSLGVAVIPAGGEITLDLSEFSGPVSIWLFDPSNGSYSVVSNSVASPLANSGTINIDPPLNAAGAADMVVKVQVA